MKKRGWVNGTTVEERLIENILLSADGCWLWTGGDNGRYGQLYINGKKKYAHRLMFALSNPETDINGLEIDHRCRKPLCINPDHLRMVTSAQNKENFDALSGRNRTGYRGIIRDDKTGKFKVYVYKDRVKHQKHGFDSLDEAVDAVRKLRCSLQTHNDIDRGGLT